MPLIIEGTSIEDTPTSRLSQIVRYGMYDRRTRAACQGELWRREQGKDGYRAPESTEDVNRLLTESRKGQRCKSATTAAK